MLPIYNQVNDEQTLNIIPYKKGSIYFCVNTGNIYFDAADSGRTNIGNDVIVLSTESERRSIYKPTVRKLYIVIESSSIYLYHDNKWNKISNNTTSDGEGSGSSSIDSIEIENIINNILTGLKESGELNGKDGVSPTISIDAIDNGHRVTITDVNDTKSVDIMNGASGENGLSIFYANISAGDAKEIIVNKSDINNLGKEIMSNMIITTDGKIFSIDSSNETDMENEYIASLLIDLNGSDGVGIKSINQTYHDKDGNTIISFTLTNNTTKNITIKNGRDGISPTVSVDAIDNGHRVTITDVNDTKSVDIMNGIDGKDGSIPNFIIGNVTTLPSNSNATATITGTSENPILNLGIPRGMTGPIISSTSDSYSETEIPDYVKIEAERLSALVQSRQNANSFTFIAGSDIHSRLDYYAGSYNTTQMLASTLHASQAMKIIINNIHIDFAALLGDYLWDSGESPEQAMSMFRVIYNYFHMAFLCIPQFWAKGNHDFLDNSANGNMALTDDQVFAGIGIHNVGNIFDPVNRIQNYCYRDFDSYNIRVICLNTSDTVEYGVSSTQINWLNSVLNSAKESGKKCFILSHMPPDELGSSSNIVKALNVYEDIIIAVIHGHIHNHSIGLINGTSDIYKIAVPCINFYRTRNLEGSETADNIPCSKISDTYKDTAFTVFTYDFNNNIIYADCYGAGYNRSINLNTGEIIVSYSIIYNLYNVSSSNATSFITDGEKYTTILTSEDGSDITVYNIIMEGTGDITSSVYSNGTITIPEVTGNIIITIGTADSSIGQEQTGSNLATLVAEDIYSNAPYNGTGYKNGYRLSSGGEPFESAATGYVMTGYINYKVTATGVPEIIYIKGAKWVEDDNNCRMYFFNSSKTSLVAPWITGNGSGSGKLTDFYTVETTDDGYMKLTPIASNNGNWKGLISGSASTAMYFRISLKGSGNNLIINMEDITGSSGSEEPGVTKYTITYNLTGVSSTNTITEIDSNMTYETTLISDNNISTISITMEGTGDITSSAYTDGVITISPVTGNIIITAIAENDSIIDTYTNLIPFSTTEMNGTEIYTGDNGEIGYRTGYRIKGSDNSNPAVDGMCCTGYIPLNGATSANDIIRIKNVTIEGSATPYLIFYNSNGTVSESFSTDKLNSAMDGNGIITISSSYNGMYAFRLSCGVIDDTSIITLNEEIK